MPGNPLPKEHSGTGGNHYRPLGTQEYYEYDSFGNRTRMQEKENTTTYTYNAAYQYNGLGYRVGKTDPENRIHYTIDLTRQYHNLLQKEENGTEENYLWDGNVAGIMEGAYYLQDELGSPIRLTDEKGHLAESYGYDEFGRDLYGNQGQLQPFGYTGYQADRIAGMYFAQAREYRPELGRFISEDIVKGVIAVPKTLNGYTYCLEAPLKFIDPTGMTYIIGWSYGKDDVEEFEKWYISRNSADEIVIDGITSDWNDIMWQEFDQRSSFARAAQTKYDELIEMGIPEEDIVLQRIDSGQDFINKWSEWSEYESVQQLHIYSHGAAGRPEIYNGGTKGLIYDTETYYQLNWKKDNYTYEPATYFYGCCTASEVTQKYANAQGVITYGNKNPTNFSSNPVVRKKISNFALDGKVYLYTYGVFDASTSWNIFWEHILGIIYNFMAGGRVRVPMERYNPNCID